MYNEQLSNIINDQILTIESETENSIIDEYKKLNDKCSAIINKIKNRRGRKDNKQIGN